MITFVLVIYLSFGAREGGPAVIGSFKERSDCLMAGQEFKDGAKTVNAYEYRYFCVATRDRR